MHLELQGNVLSFYDPRKGSGGQLQVPVELISVDQKHHSKLKQIVTPLAVLLACAITCFFAAFIVDLYYSETAEIINMIGVGFLIILIIATPITFIMAIFAKTRYAYISVVPMNYNIEFWVPKKEAQQGDEFLDSIHAKQLLTRA